MQIMECCYYLNRTSTAAAAAKNSNANEKEEDPNFVRLLTGSRALSNLADTDVTIPNKDKNAKQVPFSMAVVKKSTGKRTIFFLYNVGARRVSSDACGDKLTKCVSRRKRVNSVIRVSDYRRKLLSPGSYYMRTFHPDCVCVCVSQLFYFLRRHQRE